MKIIPKRSIALFVFLSIITFGIYGVVMICIMSKEINQICEGDGKHTIFYLIPWLVSPFTLFIWPIIWFYQAMERLCDNAYRYGVTVKHSGGEYILWTVVGSLIGIGPIVALCYFVSDVNAFANVAGAIVPKRYTSNPVERIQIENEGFPEIQSAMNGQLYDYASEQSQQYNQQQFVGSPDDTVALNQAQLMTNSAMIYVIGGSNSGYKIPINPGEVINIGKDPSMCQLIVASSYTNISRKHCSITYDAVQNIYIVTDFSTNGTYYNGTRLAKNQPSYLERGSVINLANTDNNIRLE